MIKKHILSICAFTLAACTGPAAQSPDLPETLPVADTDLPAQKELKLDAIYNGPSLSGSVPQGVKYSPDGKRVTFLRDGDGDGRYDLWQFDVETGEPSMLVSSKLLEPEEIELNEEEKALRERKRIAGRKGIVSYDWGTEDTILVPLGGNLHLVTLGSEREIQITMLPYSEEVGVTLADVAKSIREVYFGEEVQRIPRDGEQPTPRNFGPIPSEIQFEDASNIVIKIVDDEVVRLSDVAELRPKSSEPSVRQLTDTDAFEYDAKVSPGGKYVSFIRDETVWAIDLESGEEQRLTPEAEPENAIRYGVAEFVAQEEMSRYTGYWWSPDDRYLAYTRVDESTVDIIPRFDIAADEVTVIEQRYPRAGRPNAIVDLFVRDMETGGVVEVDWRSPKQLSQDAVTFEAEYLARVSWTPVENLHIQAVDRDQKIVSFMTALALRDWKTSEYDQEVAKAWINLKDAYSPNFKFRISEKSGFSTITAMSQLFNDPVFVESIGGDGWEVDKFLHWENGYRALFTGYKDTPLEKHLYAWEQKEGANKITRLTELGKSWSITMAPDGKSFVGTSSSPTQPPQTGLYKITENTYSEDGPDGTESGGVELSAELNTWIEENALDETHPYAPYLADHTVPEYGTLKAEDGSDLYYSIQTPPDFDPGKQYPVILYVYGGPGAQVVTRNWESLTDQYYTREGYIVWRLDNRGTPNRGKAFEDVIYRQMGIPEVRDQLVGVEHLKSLPYVDADRIAIHGWSYGGYMTLMTILQAPENTFAAAFAGAPVTDWSLYDTFYTERYMDTPQDNPEGYEKSSVFYHLDKLEHDLPPLMLVHGMADDNVTFDNTTRLMAELQNKGILFELMTYPGERHGIRAPGMSLHLAKTRADFFGRHLRQKD